MNSFRIAFKLFRTNIKTYGYYLGVMIFAVAVYYDFVALKHNPQVLKTEEFIMQARAASQITSFVLIIVLIFFMWYSSSFFLRQRKKEIGIYLLSGISNARIGLVFAIESLITGVAAMAGGLFLGILLSKLFIMALAKVALLNVAVEFSVPMSAVTEVAITFGAVFLVLSVANYINVAGSRLIDLISSAKKEETAPKVRVVRGILALAVIGTGYYMSIGVFETSNVPITTMAVVVLVVVGTYWFFGSFLSLVMRALVNSKKIMYRGVRIVSISNIAFRLKANYRSHAMLAIMAAVTITAFGTSLSLKYYIENTHSISFPYSFSYISEDDGVNRKVEELIKGSSHELILKEQIPYIMAEDFKMTNISFADDSKLVVRYSDFARVTSGLKVKNGEKLLKDNALSGNEVIYIQGPGVIGSTLSYKGKELSLDGSSYKIKEQMKTPLFGEPTVGNTPCVVVSDEAYERIRASHAETIFNGFVVSEADKAIELTMQLMEVVPRENGFFAYAGQYEYKDSHIGLFYFLGTFMSIVFILATGSIMYFKLLSEGLADREKYGILGEIGMSGPEIKKAVSMQVGLSLILPLIVGIVHSMFAINVLGDMLSYNLIVPTLAAIGVFALAYGIFYVATTRNFLKLVLVNRSRS